MAKYQLTDTDTVILTAERPEDRLFIPNDPRNSYRVEYDEWLAAGGKPDPSTVTTKISLTKIKGD